MVGADTEIVGGPGIDVQLSGNAGALEREVHEHAVLRRADDVVAAMQQEDRRRVGRDAQAGSQFILVLRFQVAGINRDGEVGTATDFVHVIDRLVGSFVEARRCRDGEMAARRESHDADPFRMNAPLAGFAAEDRKSVV